VLSEQIHEGLIFGTALILIGIALVNLEATESLLETLRSRRREPA
jgi:hypothetical protein